MKRRILIIFNIIILISSICIAHSGRTDSNGGHYDTSTGEYHYHSEIQIEANLDTDNEETKMYERLQETENEKEIKLEDYTEIMNIMDEKDNEIERLKDDKKALHFIYWFIILCMGIAVWNLSKQNKK